jgi:hypothetical protein
VILWAQSGQIKKVDQMSRHNGEGKIRGTRKKEKRKKLKKKFDMSQLTVPANLRPATQSLSHSADGYRAQCRLGWPSSWELSWAWVSLFYLSIALKFTGTSIKKWSRLDNYAARLV